MFMNTITDELSKRGDEWLGYSVHLPDLTIHRLFLIFLKNYDKVTILQLPEEEDYVPIDQILEAP